MKTKTSKGQPERGRSTMEDELCDLADIASRLAERAMKRGFSSAYVIAGYDPISNQNRSARGYDGNAYEVFGSLRAALKAWEDEENG